MDDNHEILPSPQKKTPAASEQPNVAGSQGPYAAESEQVAGRAMEVPHHAAQPMPSSGGGMSSSQPTQASVPSDPMTTSGQQATQTAVDDFMADMPQIADDIDLIEKEWVNKTKDIVQKTKDDPYNQNRQIVRLRADYMKKRYNKDIKLIKD